MAFIENDDLKRAIEALHIRDVWAVAYSDGILTKVPPDREGLVESPFREDGRKGSFSICHDGRGYKDFGGDGMSGNAWKFHELCWPSLSKGERAKKVIDLAVRHGYITVTPAPPPAAPSSAGSAPAAEVDPVIAKAAKAIAKRDRAREMEEQAWEESERGLHAPAPKRVETWPDFVRDHYEEGIAHMLAEPKRVTQLAADRGWPVAWAQALVDMKLTAYPWERWARPGERWAGRQKAFLVQVPRQGETPGSVRLEPIGYHQRFYSPAANGRPENKGWLYVPSIPRNGARSELERKLEQHGRDLGLEWDARRGPPAIVPPLPFVLGDLSSPAQLVVLLEGQWDAVTFFGACGWFYDDDRFDPLPDKGVMVFGIRGAQGLEAFLSYWGPWLRQWRPRAWAIADNDAAGGTWRDAPPAPPGMPRPPSLADKLVAAGCREPLVSWLKKHPARPKDKDLNDFYRAAKPTPDSMRKWMRAVGVLNAAGKWA